MVTKKNDNLFEPCRLRDRTSSKKVSTPSATEASVDLGTDGTSMTGPDFAANIETGFQIAMFQGPLCAEPVEGMAYFVESVETDRSSLEGENGTFPLHRSLGTFWAVGY